MFVSIIFIVAIVALVESQVPVISVQPDVDPLVAEIGAIVIGVHLLKPEI
jgi:hypothetical protein